MHPSESMLRKLDVLVIDIQDIGSRFYTYESTLGYALESAAITGTEIVVLDRPNPLTGVHVEGPVSDGKHLSFVDYTTEPIRHGMTMGELAKMFNSERHINARLSVVPIKGWTRSDWFDSTGLVWINLSPNMRNMNAAVLPCGLKLLRVFCSSSLRSLPLHSKNLQPRCVRLWVCARSTAHRIPRTAYRWVRGYFALTEIRGSFTAPPDLKRITDGSQPLR